MPTAQTLETQIAKLSLVISKKMAESEIREALNASAALTLLSQAQLLIESNPSMSRLLYSRAKQLGYQKFSGGSGARR